MPISSSHYRIGATHPFIHHIFDSGNFFFARLFVQTEVKAHRRRADLRAGLGDMFAKDFADGRMKNMGRRVVQHGRRATCFIDQGIDRRTG